MVIRGGGDGCRQLRTAVSRRQQPQQPRRCMLFRSIQRTGLYRVWLISVYACDRTHPCTKAADCLCRVSRASSSDFKPERWKHGPAAQAAAADYRDYRTTGVSMGYTYLHSYSPYSSTAETRKLAQ